MPVTCKELFVIPRRLKLVLSRFLVMLLTLSSIATAQQPTADLPVKPDDKQNAKLAVYQVHRLAEKILALRSVRAKAFEIARLASLLWKHDESHARFLFEK